MKVVLIGFMGTGKTTVGKLLAQKLKVPFYDTDEMIVQQVGMIIPDIFAFKGEPYFRDAETAALHMLDALDNGVIATGGGAVLKDENKEILKDKSFVVHLTAEPATILKRVGEGALRPLFPKGEQMLAQVQKLLDQRQAHYEACRSQAIATDDKSAKNIADVIFQSVNKK